jgi:TPR repeat protein
MNADRITSARSIGVYLRSSAVAVLLFASCTLPAAAQDKPAPKSVNVEDLRIRADAGDKGATRQLAEMFYVGRGGVEQNFTEAARWYEKLAKQGDARAQTSLGLMYARGYGVPKNLETARRWWSFAALQNDPGAQFNLGLLYSRGEGVPEDLPQAAQWYNRAAVRGHVQAQHNLGMLYHGGLGVERDPVRAYYWIKVAALQGDDVAQDSLKLVAKGMSDEQIREAEAQAGEWMRKYKKILK